MTITEQDAGQDAEQGKRDLRSSHDTVVSIDELRAQGRELRKTLPRSSQAEFAPSPDRDPIGILATQNAGRIAELVPLRLERMLADPFAFYRGTAAIQAADLAQQPSTGVEITICGDAHLANFGIYSSPQQRLVFDLNDFDEAGQGPWEWDVKRFVTSVVIAARHRGFSPDEVRSAALAAASGYRHALHGALQLGAVERFYLQSDVEAAVESYRSATRKAIDRTVAAAGKRTSERVVKKITQRMPDGSLAIVENPPVLTHLTAEDERFATNLVERYLESTSADIAVLLSQFTLTDAARRVVGVGSVGTRCYIAVFTGPSGESLILQIKQATRSVIDEFALDRGHALPPAIDKEPLRPLHGFRVVAAQRILQAVSDPFLGHFRSDGGGHYYVRQFRDRNASFDLEQLALGPFTDYVTACAFMLGRSHAQSAGAPTIEGYLGASDAFDLAVVDWATAYADQSLADFQATRAAVDDGVLR